MKVCLIGQKRTVLDEGMININYHLHHLLHKKVSLLQVDLRDFFTIRGFKKIYCFSPCIIHYLHGPTWRSLLFCWFLGIIFKKTKIVLSAPNPALNSVPDFFIKLFSVDHVFTVTRSFYNRLKNIGISCELIYPGVDQEKFSPSTYDIKKRLRQKMNIVSDKIIILHVGHFTKARCVIDLIPLQEKYYKKVQFIIVGSSTNCPDEKILKKLRESKIMLKTDYVEDIEDIYKLSDIYIFPCNRKDSAIDIPLSVFEAMAVNLFVITTKYGGLCDLFDENESFHYIQSLGDVENILSNFNANNVQVTREMVKEFTWEKYVSSILSTYQRLLGKNNEKREW